MSDHTPETQPHSTAVGWVARRHSRAVLWVLVVLGAFLALGALWFALFGNAQVIGPDAGPGPRLQPATSTASSEAASPTVPITGDDVKAVLAQVDYAESSDASITEYNHMISHAVAGVDLATFAQSTLESTSTIWWVDPSTGASSTLSGAEKDAVVAESIALWLKREDSIGETTTLSDLIGVRMYPPTAADRNRPDSLLEVVGQGLAPLGLMFGARDAGNVWDWQVEQIAVTGPRTADVTYSASVEHGQRWRFADPSAHYLKHLTFSTTGGGGWRLAGWGNYDDIRSRFQSNVRPPGAVPPLDEWWGSL